MYLSHRTEAYCGACDGFVPLLVAQDRAPALGDDANEGYLLCDLACSECGATITTLRERPYVPGR